MNEPRWLKETPLQHLFAATRAAGGEARAVGGAVRDWLLTIEATEIDIASTLTPEQTIAMAAAQGWKAVPTGIDHGTVTLVLAQKQVIEVTTLRRDVQTDGRHAVVAFTDDWQEDAARRDFTMNALSMDAEGTVFDYFGGTQDIADGRVRFIGDALTRITEDGLRILRFFRFLAAVGKPPADTDALAAIAVKKDRIALLSGERIANEMRKLLCAENPAYALRLMQETGVAECVFGRSIEPSTMIRMQLLEARADDQASVWARTLGMLPNAAATDAKYLAERWKLSRHEAQQLSLLVGLPRFDAAAPRYAHTRMLRLHGAPAYLDWLLLQAATIPGIDITPYAALARMFTVPVFPLSAKDLMARGMKEGKALGEKLAALEQRWEMSDYALSKEELLAD